jgi:hypothetical protein
MHDLDILDGKPPSAVEVSSAADAEAIELWKLLNNGDRWIEPQIDGGWTVAVKPNARAKRLRAELPAFLAALEEQAVAALDVSWQRRHPLVDAAASLGIGHAFQGGTAYRGSIYITVELAMERSGGAVDECGNRLGEWIGDFLAEPDQTDVRAKLARSGALHRHAFVILPGFSTAPFPVADTLAAGCSGIPDTPPKLPVEVTHVWAATTWSSGNGLRWSPAGGWARFQLE